MVQAVKGPPFSGNVGEVALLHLKRHIKGCVFDLTQKGIEKCM